VSGPHDELRDRFRGVLVGTAVGDALGLPGEGIARGRARRIFPGRPRHRFVLGRGMVSDDTEHTVFVAQSLLCHPGDASRFASRLAGCLRWWLLSLPAGIGFATLRSILRLWTGRPPSRSGVFSAGNGAAMRSAPIGAFFARSPEAMERYIGGSTRLTHTDPRALIGAHAVAAVTAWTIRERFVERPSPEAFLTLLESIGRDDDEWSRLVDSIRRGHDDDLAVHRFAARLGLDKGVSGYVYDTVPVALYAWFRHFGDFEGTLTAVLECGGDTDTIGAIAGALAGAQVGERGVPRDWVRGVVDWPRGVPLLRRLADRLASVSSTREPDRPVRYFWPAVPLRNLLFLLVVLSHGLRRLAPPF
jgi:ADP-ribosylglycohydrolase